MSWDIKYVLLIFSTTLVSYTCARLVEQSSNNKIKKCFMGLALIFSLGILFLFKYFNFFSSNFCLILNKLSIKLNPTTLNLILPVGISFYTFQTLSYVIDVYRGEVKAEHHLGKYATFISFFPQLVAGPIERSRNLLPQINNEHSFHYDKATYGMKLMTWGFFKKLVVSDTLAIYADNIYKDITSFSGFSFVLATFFFSLQIYCDFSGYSDIAIGTAKLFDIDLMTNFKSPYYSASIKEFWSRWHISLSTWFRDYIYIPLGGNRCSKIRHSLNLLITFLVSGFWHGASWTYIFWGGIHGITQIIENMLPVSKKKTGVKYYLKLWSSILVVFIVSNIAWVFFRAPALADAFYILRHSLSGIANFPYYIIKGFKDCGIYGSMPIRLIFMFFLLFSFDFFNLNNDFIQTISKKSVIIRWSAYIFIVLVILFLSPAGSEKEFIYFQF